jgi:hypothetical protein
MSYVLRLKNTRCAATAAGLLLAGCQFAGCGGSEQSSTAMDAVVAKAAAGRSGRAGTGGAGGTRSMVRDRAGGSGVGGDAQGGGGGQRQAPDANGTSTKLPTNRILGSGCEFVDEAGWRTPDGSKLLLRCSEGLGLMPVDGGKFVPLTDSAHASSVVLSNERLVYLDTMQLISVPTAGGEPKTLAIDVIDNLQYSADRTLAVFERARTSEGEIPLYAVDTAGEAEAVKVVDAKAAGARLLPDGRHLVYDSGSRQLSTVDVVQHEPMPLGQADIDDVLFSTSGKLLAFYDSANKHAVVARAEGGIQQLGDASPDELAPFAFTADETAILAGYNDYSYKGSRTVLLTLDGKTSTTIAQDKWVDGAVVSPRGNVISAQRGDSKSSLELWLHTGTDDKMIGNLERCPRREDTPLVSSGDGSRVLYIDLHGSLVILDLDSTEQLVNLEKLVPVGSTCTATPSWSSNGEMVLVSSCKSGSYDCEVFTVNAVSSARGPTLGTTQATTADFSADAKYVAYRNKSGETELHAVAGPSIAKAYWEHSHWLDAARFVYGTGSLEHEVHLLTFP